MKPAMNKIILNEKSKNKATLMTQVMMNSLMRFPTRKFENAVNQDEYKNYPVSNPREIRGPDRRNRNVVESSMFQSRQNGYHMISSNEYKYMSEPQGFNYEIRNEYQGNSLNNDNSLQDSLKNVLSNSFHFF